MDWPNFEAFWSEYPRKVGRFKAEKIWLKLSSYQRCSAIEGMRKWKQTVQWQENCGMYIPYGSTFLAQKRYLDPPWNGAFDEQC